MNKREVVLSLIEPGIQTPYTPAGFFIHFDKKYHRGLPAIEKHLEYFRYTDMDFVKIQYELSFPPNPEISDPEDWTNIPKFRNNFFKDQWDIIKGLVERVGKESLVIQTLYSPFMCAGQMVNRAILEKHIWDHPNQVIKGMEIITDSLLTFVDGCINQGVDGFYHSTQGGEIDRFGGTARFDECIKPFDLALMNHINERTKFNILHICDYHGNYGDYSAYSAYPGDIVNCSLQLEKHEVTGEDITNMFNRPFMGGLDRHGVIVKGKDSEIRNEVKRVIQDSPQKFFLAADCTLPADIPWENIRTAIQEAHLPKE